MSVLLPLHVRVKRKRSRVNDPDLAEHQEAFNNIRQKVLERDRYTCRFCGMPTVPTEVRPSGYFEVHHLDDDHRNNRLDNLVTTCPFCHMVFTAGRRGDDFVTRQSSGTLLWLPWISQGLLNRLAHVIFQVLYLDIKTVNDLGLMGLRSSALHVQQSLMDQGVFGIDFLFGRDADGECAQAHHLYDVLVGLSPDLYDRYLESDIVSGLRIWPVQEVFQDPIAYWHEYVWKPIPPSSWMDLLQDLEAKIKG